MSTTHMSGHHAGTLDRRTALSLGLAVAGALLLSMVYLAGLEGSSMNWVLALCREDGVVETLSALAYLAGFSVCLLAMIRGQRSLMLVVWTILCFLFLGEETSWFQRIVGYHVAAVEHVNVQSEFNLHNLPELAGIGWRDVNSADTFLRAMFGSQNLFQMGFAAFFLVLPIVSAWRVTVPLQEFVGYRRPELLPLAIVWGLVALSYVYVSFASGALHKDALVETRELVFAAAILHYVTLLVRRRTTHIAPAIRTGR